VTSDLVEPLRAKFLSLFPDYPPPAQSDRAEGPPTMSSPLCSKPYHGGPCVRIAGHPGRCTKNIRCAPFDDIDDGMITIEETEAHPARFASHDGNPRAPFSVWPPQHT